ncbi:hypothetical protein I317_04969 [Kwoniella heveanensis CBS 569]|nr:hypothetical protein I317_04969 [Kwoniella heveanensis CBS 569]
MTSVHNHPCSPTIPKLLQSRASAVSSIPQSQTTQTFMNLSSPPPPLPPPRTLADISPTTSSPSLYSRVGHSSPRVQMAITTCRLRALSDSSTSGTEGEEEEEEEDDPRRMSMVGGPKVRKYTQVPWEEDWSAGPTHTHSQPPVPSSARNGTTTRNHSRGTSHERGAGPTIVGSADMFSGFSKHATRMISAATSKTSSYPYSSSNSKGRSRDPSVASNVTVSSTDSSNTMLDLSATRRGLAQILGVSHSHSQSQAHSTHSTGPSGVKHLLPSASGLSLASNQTTSTASSDDRSTPITPKLRSHSNGRLEISPTLAFTSSKKGRSNEPYSAINEDNQCMTLLPAIVPRTNTYKKPAPAIDPLAPTTLTASLTSATTGYTFAAPDRPLLSSGSPGFGLISLEAAQERERARNLPRTQPNGASEPSANELERSATHNISQHQRAETSYTQPRSNVQQMEMTPRPATTYAVPPIPDDPPNPLRPTTSCTSAPALASASGASSPPNRVRAKKSGLMRLFNKSDKAQNGHTPPLPTTSSAAVGAATPTSKGRDGRSSLWSDHHLPSTGVPAVPSDFLPGKSAVWPTSKTGPKRAIPAHVIDNFGSSSDGVIGRGSKPQLELRPVSMTFTRGLPVDYLSSVNVATNGPDNGPAPSSPTALLKGHKDGDAISAELAKRLKEQILNTKKAWKMQLFEMEAQVRELRDELEETRTAALERQSGSCSACGCSCGGVGGNDSLSVNGGEQRSRRVIDRARVKTAGARGVFGSGSLYEWE